MATTEQAREGVDRKRLALIGLGFLVVVGIVAIVLGMRHAPQMGSDEQVFRTVDALYTAVCSRDANRLAECEQRLHGYRDAGKLSADAADFLDGIVAQSRAGEWSAAAERLYHFMLAQRREGALEPPTPKPDPKAKRK